MSRVLRLLAVCAALALAVAGCGRAAGAGHPGDGRVQVVTTTNFITDLAQQIGGRRVDVTGLMGPGVDPHLYKASANDVSALADAELVLYGGLDLEGKMADAFAKLAEWKPTVAVTDGMPRDRLRAVPGFAGKYDPHVWFDVDLWRYAAREAAKALGDVDPAGRAYYQRRLRAYDRKLVELDREIARGIASIPPERRVLVTTHDAFGYFGDRYGIDVVAIQGVSTATEATTADVERVAKVIADRGVKAVFVESSTPPQTIEAVLASAARQGGQAHIGGSLYADAAGDADTPEGTYIGMVRHNLHEIVEGLR
ncbi:MAG TPA: zinc ABC transporter substrate-binding protein [Capillimicrobium sp.]|nr:zinc ABC transporter substrate-binding protein [Capillimicrobium sp.]